MTNELQKVEHAIEPVFDRDSRVLLLGSLPSPKSREVGFFYGNPQNRFWRVMAEMLGEPLAQSTEEMRAQLLRNHIALWDVLASCEIAGASDVSIRNPVPNDPSPILECSEVQAVFCTGSKAGQLYRRLTEPSTGVPCTVLPSTSPANAAWRLDDLVRAYSEAILPYLG